MVFLESPWFTRRLHDYAGDEADDVLQGIQNDLLSNPFRGVIVPGLGGVRKARIGNPQRQKGKRGGYRYFYLYLEQREHIHLVAILSKGKREDLSPEEREIVRRIATAVRGSL